MVSFPSRPSGSPIEGGIEPTVRDALLSPRRQELQTRRPSLVARRSGADAVGEIRQWLLQPPDAPLLRQNELPSAALGVETGNVQGDHRDVLLLKSWDLLTAAAHRRGNKTTEGTPRGAQRPLGSGDIETQLDRSRLFFDGSFSSATSRWPAEGGARPYSWVVRQPPLRPHTLQVAELPGQLETRGRVGRIGLRTRRQTPPSPFCNRGGLRRARGGSPRCALGRSQCSSPLLCRSDVDAVLRSKSRMNAKRTKTTTERRRACAETSDPGVIPAFVPDPHAQERLPEGGMPSTVNNDIVDLRLRQGQRRLLGSLRAMPIRFRCRQPWMGSGRGSRFRRCRGSVRYEAGVSDDDEAAGRASFFSARASSPATAKATATGPDYPVALGLLFEIREGVSPNTAVVRPHRGVTPAGAGSVFATERASGKRRKPLRREGPDDRVASIAVRDHRLGTTMGTALAGSIRCRCQPTPGNRMPLARSRGKRTGVGSTGSTRRGLALRREILSSARFRRRNPSGPAHDDASASAGRLPCPVIPRGDGQIVALRSCLASESRVLARRSRARSRRATPRKDSGVLAFRHRNDRGGEGLLPLERLDLGRGPCICIPENRTRRACLPRRISSFLRSEKPPCSADSELGDESLARAGCAPGPERHFDLRRTELGSGEQSKRDRRAGACVMRPLRDRFRQPRRLSSWSGASTAWFSSSPAPMARSE